MMPWQMSVEISTDAKNKAVNMQRESVEEGFLFKGQ